MSARQAIFPIAALALLAGCGAQAEAPPVVADASLEGHVLFVTNKGEDTLSKVDLGTGEGVQRVDSCSNPHELAVSPDGETLAVGCYGGQTIDLFSTGDLARVGSIDLGGNARPHGIVWHENGTIYATAEGRDAVFSVADPLGDTPQLTEIKTDRAGTHMLAVEPDMARLWSADMQAGTVTVVDLENGTRLRSVELGGEPEGIDFSRENNALWVSAREGNLAYELDPETLEVRRELATGQFPLRLMIRPQGDVAITSDLADGGLSVIDLVNGEITRSITVSGPEEAEQRFQVTVIWSDDGERIYAAETGSNTVAEVDYASGEVLRRFAVGTQGDGLAVLAPREDQGEAGDSE